MNEDPKYTDVVLDTTTPFPCGLCGKLVTGKTHFKHHDEECKHPDAKLKPGDAICKNGIWYDIQQDRSLKVVNFDDDN